MSTYKLINGDCIEEMKKMDANSIDSIVTDPPYEIGFMNKGWDNTGIAYNKDMWKQALRVLKPGGHMLAFSSTRTYHRMVCAIEDSGFEIRDQLAWIYGCLTEDTEILTDKGWKRYDKSKLDNTYNQDKILVYDIEKDIYKWEEPQRWSFYSINKDKVFRLKSDTTDQIVSRNHNCVVERNGKLVFRKAEELFDVEYVPTLPEDFYSLQKDKIGLLQSSMQWSISGNRMEETFTSGTDWLYKKEKNRSSQENDGSEESCLERWGDLSKSEGKLQESKNQNGSLSNRISNNGKKQWICSGIQAEYGDGDLSSSNKARVRSSYRPQCGEQSYQQSNVICDEQRPQTLRMGKSYNTTLATISEEEYTGIIFCPTTSTGAFVARRNGKVFITGNSGFPKSQNVGKMIDKKAGKTKDAKKYDGWGTALKPAQEPIVLARKPLSEKTVAANVIKHTTGAMNIDGCRVATDDKFGGGAKGSSGFAAGYTDEGWVAGSDKGRWPANIIHDGSAEVLELFPESKGAVSNSKKSKTGNGPAGIYCGTSELKEGYNDSGSAARFFYCAKANKHDRNEGLDIDYIIKYDTGLCKEENMELVALLQKDTSVSIMKWNIDESGKAITAMYQKNCLSTTLMKINKTTIYQICNSLTPLLTKEYIQDANSEIENGTNPAKSVDNTKRLNKTIIKEKTASVQDVKDVVSKMLLYISNEKNWEPFRNIHSTVKPTALMMYLIKLITPIGGTVLDPFNGSGSTGKAAMLHKQYNYIGIDLCAEYIQISKARIIDAIKNKDKQSDIKDKEIDEEIDTQFLFDNV